MYKITFTGSNSSLKKYGIRFEPGKPQMIEDAKLANKLEAETDFKVEKMAGEAPAASSDEDKEPTLTALKEQAKEAQIDGYTKMDKQQLMDALATIKKSDDPYANAPTT